MQYYVLQTWEELMERLLSIGEVARRLGVSVDVVRSLTENGQLKAVRTGGGHRRYRPEEVERFTKTRRAPPKKPPPERPPGKPPKRVDLEEADFEEDSPSFEELGAEIARAEAKQRADAERQRLEGLKKYGRDLALWSLLPAEGRVLVYEDLEEFVTSKRMPPSLSVTEAQLVVSARVQQVAKQYHEAENVRLTQEREAQEQRQRAEAERRQRERDAAAERQRLEAERQKQEREAEEQRRKQQEDERRLDALIERGTNYAWSETLTGWDSAEAQRARRDVERALKDEVKADWSEAEVEDLVNDVLYDGDEDEEDEDEEDDESW
jgi:excisionase family DNA binding protein